MTIRAFAVAMSASLLFVGPSAVAQPGDLDPNFGHNGIAIRPPDSAGYALTTQPDGKILVTGYLAQATAGMGVARYLPDGTLDTTFGVDGVASVGPGPGATTTGAVALEPDGKIVLTADIYPDLAVGRLNPDGTPDTSFGTDGYVLTPMPPFGFEPHGLLVWSNGDILVGGVGSLESDRYPAGSIVRYLPDGALDAGFGRGGFMTPRRPSLSFGPMAPGPDGAFYAGATHFYPRSPGHWGSSIVAARITVRGHLDRSFGTNGLAAAGFDRDTFGAEGVTALALAPDGKLVVTGRYGPGRVAVARFNPDGTPDSSFSKDGWTATAFPSCDVDHAIAMGQGVAVQPNGQIVVAASVEYHLVGCGHGGIGLVRYTDRGVLDATFGDGGRVFTEGTHDTTLFPRAMVLLPTHRILVTGDAGGVLLAQYLAS